MDRDQIVIRDSIVLAVGLLFVAAGLTDALHLLTGLSWWSTVPMGAGLWIAATVLFYRRTQRTIHEMADPTAS